MPKSYILNHQFFHPQFITNIEFNKPDTVFFISLPLFLEHGPSFIFVGVNTSQCLGELVGGSGIRGILNRV